MLDFVAIPFAAHRSFGRRCFAGLWIWLVSGSLGFAAAFKATLDNTSLEVGDSTFLNLVFEDLPVGNPPRLPNIPNARIEYQGAQQRTEIVNRRRTSSIIFQYLLSPLSVGEVSIPALEVTVSGSKYSTDPLKLAVTAPTMSAIPPGANKLAFLRLVSPTNEVYYGESFPVEVKLYYLTSIEPDAPKLDLDGFTIGKSAQPEAGRTRIGGQVYSVVTWRMAATAAKLGQLPFGPAELDAIVKVAPRGRDPVRDFFGGGVFDDVFAERKRVKLQTESNVVHVVSPPTAGRPADYAGAVGQFRLQATVSPTNLAVGDPITVRIQISGEGNLEQLPPPKLKAADGFRAYEMRSEVQTTDSLGLVGTRTFEQVLVPENLEVKQLPEILFSYFDPRARRYFSVNRPSVPIQVRAANVPQATPSRATTANDDAANPVSAGDELRHIKMRSGAIMASTPLVTRPLYLFLLGLPLPLYALVGAALRYHARRGNDPERARRRQLERGVSEGLAALTEPARQGNSGEFFERLGGVLRNQIGLVLDRPPAGITGEEIDTRLRPMGLPSEVADQLQYLFEVMDQARYSPINSSQELTDLRDRAKSACQALSEWKLQ